MKYKNLYIVLLACLLCQGNNNLIVAKDNNKNKNIITKSKENLDYKAIKIKNDFEPIALVNSKKDSLLLDSKNNPISFSGSSTTQFVAKKNTNSFDSSNINDSTLNVTSVLDSNFDVKTERIKFNAEIRLKNNWGNSAVVFTSIPSINIADATIKGSSLQLSNHVLFARKAFLEIDFCNKSLDNFIKLGLFPFELGNGISLGSAYKVSGYLGFKSDFSIDQFTPGVLLQYDFSVFNSFAPKIKVYGALLENLQSSYKNNSAVVYSNALDNNGVVTRGIDKNAYLVALSAEYKYKKGLTDINLEPYFVSQKAPFQKIEFDGDSAVNLKTLGFYGNAKYNKFYFSFELGRNFGAQNICAWDRNQIQLAVDSNGNIIEQYTKIYNQSPNNKSNLALMAASSVNKNIVNTQVNKSYLQNSEAINYNDSTAGLTTSTLFNALDRFRPAQKKSLEGMFVVSDFVYSIKPEVLDFILGGGFVSGQLDSSVNLNNCTQEELMAQKYSGFVPLQSVYSGKKLKSIMLLAEGLPRYSAADPGVSFEEVNLNNSRNDDILNTFTNLIYFGFSADWKVQAFKKYNLKIIPTFINYFSDDSPLIDSVNNIYASRALGFEVSLQISGKVFENLELNCNSGIFVPGKQYSQMKDINGTINGIQMGNSPAFMANIGLSFKF